MQRELSQGAEEPDVARGCDAHQTVTRPYFSKFRKVMRGLTTHICAVYILLLPKTYLTMPNPKTFQLKEKVELDVARGVGWRRLSIITLMLVFVDHR